MKLSIDRDQILDSLGKVQSIVGTRSAIKILANVLIQADKDSISFTTTDLDISVRCEAMAKVERKGGITLPAKRAYSLFRELPAGTVEIEVDDDDSASIVCGASKFRLLGLSEDDFPPLPKYKEGDSFTLEQRVFKDMLRKTSYAAYFEESRPTLVGLNMVIADGSFTVVGTDSRRLAMVEQEIPGLTGSTDFILPNKAVNELQRSLSDDGDVTIYVTGNQVAFDLGHTVIVSKVIDGVYPTFRQVIPSECAVRVTVERELLLDAVKRAALLCTENTNSVRMIFDDNHLTVTTDSKDVGSSEERLPIKFSADKIQINFNPDYVTEPLRNLDSDEIYFEMSDDLSPGVIKTDVPFLYVLMPLRVNT